jgi:biopolymer transport protein ExbD
VVQAVQVVPKLMFAALAALVGCSPEAPQPPLVDAVLVNIDANNDCSMAGAAVECRNVAAVVHAKYPTSHPRVDLCVDKTSRYEASAEVMKSVTDGGLTVGNFDCDKTAPAAN